MELLHWFATILTLAAQDMMDEAILLLILCLLYRCVNDVPVSFSSSLLRDWLVKPLHLVKRKALIYDRVHAENDLEEDFMEMIALASNAIKLSEAPIPRARRRFWKDPTRPGNMFHMMQLWPAQDALYPGLMDKRYLESFRVRHETFNMILNILEDSLPPPGNDGHYPNLHQPLSPRQKLAITLYWIAKGVHYSEAADIFNVGVTTVFKVIRQV